MRLAKRTPMMEQYETIKQTCEDALLFFRLGDFYELFYEDAKIASSILDLTLTGRGSGDQRMPMCGVPYHAADNYISRLVAKGFKVAICEQVEDPKETKGLVRREIIRLITPGTAHEFVRQDTYRPLIATFVELTEGIVEGAIADALTGNVWIKQGDYLALTNWFERMQVSEVVADDKLYATCAKHLKEYSVRANIAYSQVPAHEDADHSFESYSASQLLVTYLEHTSKRSLDHMKLPEAMGKDRFMELTASTIRHLEVIRPATEGRKDATLFDTLNFTSNAMGRRYLREMLEHPLYDLSIITQRLDMIEHLVKNPLLQGELQNGLKEMYDLTRIVSRISFGQVSPRDLWYLAQSLQVVAVLKKNIQATDSVSEIFVGIIQHLHECQELAQMIGSILSEEVLDNNKNGAIIKQGANTTIDELRAIVQGGRAHILSIEQAERVRTGIKSLKVGYNRVFGYYIEVTSANAHLVPDDYERKQTLTSAERYVTKELREREYEIVLANEKLAELELALIDEIVDVARAQLRQIQETADALGQLDALVGLAKAAISYHYTRPIVDHSCNMKIEGGRHPVVERHAVDGFIENDVLLSNDKRQIALITGPNMGGKSTYMRQTALIVIMAQIGSFVPAAFAQIGIVDKLFTRIGASDDVSAGLSTFMVEMTESAEILHEATDHSLLIFDEIGRGTATYDGMSIAEAIVEYVHDRIGARSLFATHYHELTELPRRLPRVFNLSVAVKEDDHQIVFLHRVVERFADRSYGIQVAQKAGLPESVTARARTILTELERGVQEIASTTQQMEFAFPDMQDVKQALYKEYLNEVMDLQLDEFTPKQALIYLYELQERIRKGIDHGIDPRTR